MHETHQALRVQLRGILSNDDLPFPRATNQTFGKYSHTIGEAQETDITSSETFERDFAHPNHDEDRASSFGCRIESPGAGGPTRSPQRGLLVLNGKASVHLLAMGKEAPQQWRSWIA